MAFDTIEHSTILGMMKAYGFPDKWVTWTSNILPLATTSALLNGVPGKSLKCNRGVRQGDPMSPLLFVMAAELLQCVINKAHHQGLFQLPIPSMEEVGYPIIQYADDTIMIMSASQGELLSLRANFSKSCQVPLNMPQEKAQILAGVFEFHLQGMPFTYLGLPMGTTKPRVEHYAPLMNRVKRQLTSISLMLTQAGKLQLVNSVLSSLPTYTMCSVQVLVALLEYFDRARRYGLSNKTESNARSRPRVAWKKCTRSKKKGGLGIINLRM
jgi:hypothetical protein